MDRSLIDNRKVIDLTQEQAEELLHTELKDLGFRWVVHVEDGSSPSRLPRVCIPLHGIELLSGFFETLVWDIDSAAPCRCAEFMPFYPESYVNENRELLKSEFSQMDIFIIPITSLYLDDAHIERFSLEFDLAMQLHVPVLPVAMEDNISDRFTSQMNCFHPGYGDLQILNRMQHDSTEIPYLEKLRQRLKCLLFTGDMMQRVRASFNDTRIFLSYRKKDRYEALKLMNQIHNIPGYQDIAIWYDEYLESGEKWNDAIEHAMENSRAVVLAITPHMLEPGNYVIEKEYKMALKKNIPVIPVELQPTDRGELKKFFKGIGVPVECKDITELSEALRRFFEKKNNQDPANNYLTGLAFLGGIEVEHDRERAVKLITEAAEAGNPDAMERLAGMYKEGICVQHSIEAAAKWQKKFVAAMEQRGGASCDAQLDLADMLKKLGRDREAEKILNRIVMQGLKLHDRDEKESYRVLSRSLDRLGDIWYRRGNYNQAEEYYEMCFELVQESAENTPLESEQKDLVIISDKMGTVYSKLGKMQEAEKYFLLAVRTAEQMLKDYRSPTAKYMISTACGGTAELYLKTQHLANSEIYAKRSLQILEGMKGEEAEKQKAIAENRLNRISFTIEMQEAAELQKKVSEKIKNKNWQEAYASCSRLIDLYKKVGEDCELPEVKYNAAISYRQAGEILAELGRNDEALRYLQQALYRFRKLNLEKKTEENLRQCVWTLETIAAVQHARKNVSTEKRWVKEYIDELERLADQYKNPDDLRDLFERCYEIGTGYAESKRLEIARKYLRKSAGAGEQLAKQKRVDYWKLSIVCAYLGELGDYEMRERRCEILQMLVKREPENKKYADELKHARKKLGFMAKRICSLIATAVDEDEKKENEE